MGALALRIILCSALALIGCGAGLPNRLENGNNENIPQSLSGAFTAISGQTLDLSGGQDPIVLIFASDTCAICREEAQELVAYFNARGRPPTNTRFFSILVGAIREDAEIWQQELAVSWPVGFQEGDSTFRAFCPRGQTPCVVTSNPRTGFLRSRSGKVSIQTLEEETGPWTF